MKKFDPTNLKPCTHMQVLVSAHVDSMLPQVADWYTRHHVKGCRQCQASIPFLNSLKDRLHGLEDSTGDAALTSERLEAIQQNLDKIDTENQMIGQ